MERGPDAILVDAAAVAFRAEVELRAADLPPPVIGSAQDPARAVASVTDPEEQQRIDFDLAENNKIISDYSERIFDREAFQESLTETEKELF